MICKVAALVEESKKFQKMVGKMKHLKLDKHGEMAGGHNPQQVLPLPLPLPHPQFVFGIWSWRVTRRARRRCSS
jgi:hypothetical protein